MKSDSDIGHDVGDELRYDPNVHAGDIAGAVKEGAVALTGLVPSYAATSAAERAVQRLDRRKADRGRGGWRRRRVDG